MTPLKARPCAFHSFFPDRDKDLSQYAILPKDANGQDIEVEDYGNPHILSIQVIGDFQTALGQATNWQPEPENLMLREEHPSGFIYTYTTQKALPAGFYQYKYFLTFDDGTTRRVSDPCARYGGTDHQNSAFVIGPSTVPTVNPLAFPRKHPRDLVIYELNIDDFTDEIRDGRAPVDVVCTKLDALAGLGFNAILFLPWTAWADDNYSWGYTPYQYFSVEHRYTHDLTDASQRGETVQLSRLKNLINECHRRGHHVIMDGVFNHVGSDTDPHASGFPYRWLYRDPKASPYIGIFGGTFSTLKDLDYHNGCTQQFIRDVCFYWMDEFGIDGIRFDNTTNFYVKDDPRGLPQLLADISAHAGDVNFSLTLEHLDPNAAEVTNRTAATGFWNNALFGSCFDCLWNDRITPGLMAALDAHGTWLEAEKTSTLYLSNHDHSHVTWQCGAKDNLGSMLWFRTQPYAIALLTAPGTPMIQNGQECAEDYWIPEDDGGSSRRVKTRPYRWEFPDDPIGRQLSDVYKKLLGIRHRFAGLRSNNFYPSGWQSWQTQFNEFGYGIDAARGLMIYHRWGVNEQGTLERFIVVLNFSGADTWVDVPFPESGGWLDVLNGTSVSVNDFWLRGWKVNSNWGNVFFK